MPDFLGPVETVLSIAAILGSAAFAVWRKWCQRVDVRRIRSGEDPWFDRAMEFYETPEIFPEHERDHPDDIANWLKEARERRLQGDTGIEEYVIAIITEARVRGLLYATYYKSEGLLFVSYLILQDMDAAVRNIAVQKLFACLRRWMVADGFSCRGVVAEVELPSTATSEKERNHRHARIRTLLRLARGGGIELRVVEAQYTQPKLDLNDASKREDWMLLLYGPLSDLPPTTMSRGQVSELFQFIYARLYGDSFMGDKERDIPWRAYVAQLLAQSTSKLPETVCCSTRYREPVQERT
jgi:hypothetical protein